jgi:hypothetical protein
MRRQAKRFTPFGQGIRNCLGQQLARMNVPTAVAMFVSNFHLELSPEVRLFMHLNLQSLQKFVVLISNGTVCLLFRAVVIAMVYCDLEIIIELTFACRMPRRAWKIWKC